MDGEQRVAVQHLVVAIAWPFSVLSAARVFYLVDYRHQYFAPMVGIAASIALAACPMIFLGLHERLRRQIGDEISICASGAVLCGIYMAAWRLSLVVFGPYKFS